MKYRKSKLIKIAALTLGLTGILGTTQANASTPYEIQRGDTLYSLAKKHHVTVAQLMQVNNLKSSMIYSGYTLDIPTTITIKKGDTLYSLAKKYNSSVSQLKHINHLSSNTIYVGQKLIIPSVVTVKKGDTLYSIATNYGLTVEALKSLNYLSSDFIKVGQKLNVAYSGKTFSFQKDYDASNIQVDVTVKNGFTFDAEEPRTFIIQYSKDGSYFSRIEVLDSNANINEVKKNAKDYLKGQKITEYNPNPLSHPFYKEAIFFLHGFNDKAQTNIIVKEVDGVLLRFTIHYLNQEESEGITPHMIDILQTAKVK